MHIYCLTRGLIPVLREWENFLTSQYLPFKVLEKDKTEPTNYLAQLQVREVKMYEIVCPEECEDNVMGMLKPTTNEGFGGKFGKLVNPLRKILGLKKPSTTWKPSLLPKTDGMSLIVLGTKKDKLGWVKEEKRDVESLGGVPQEYL